MFGGGNEKGVAHSLVAGQRVLFICDDDPAHRGPRKFVSLPDPKTRKDRTFVRSGESLLEVLVTRDDPTSLLVGNSVERDATMLVATQFDARFILLPRLSEICRVPAPPAGTSSFPACLAGDGDAGLFVPVAAIVSGDSGLDALRGVRVPLETICETRSSTVRLSAAKVVRWLLAAVERTAVALVADHSASTDAIRSGQAATFRRAGSGASGDASRAAGARRAAAGIISENLPSAWSALLDTAVAAVSGELGAPVDPLEGISAAPSSETAAVSPRDGAVAEAVSPAAERDPKRARTAGASAKPGSPEGSGVPPTPPVVVASHDALAGLAGPLESFDRDQAFGFAGGRPAGYSAAAADDFDGAGPAMPQKPKQTMLNKRLEKVGSKGMKKLSSFFGATAKK